MPANPGPSTPLLVATLGPASLAVAEAVAAAGASCFRLNASHMAPDALSAAAAGVRAALPALRMTVDLQGAKMRVGRFDPRPVALEEVVRFAVSPDDPAALPLHHPVLFASLEKGDTLSFDDDRIRMRVEAVTGGSLEARCVLPGILRPRKGINVIEHPVELDELSPQDLEHIRAVQGLGAIDFAFSFMLDGREAAWVRGVAPEARVIGKIERREAIDSIDAIAVACDEVWICRGDLGAQLGPVELARRIAALRPRSHASPVLMAGQVLEHLTRHREPTRSEVCHLFDLLDRGYAGIVLSDETAIGDDPVHAVHTARALCDAMSALA